MDFHILKRQELTIKIASSRVYTLFYLYLEVSMDTSIIIFKLIKTNIFSVSYVWILILTFYLETDH